ncbi:hypothetical protein B0T17DRAFT_502265 [Bombardia bombarda]|uniref:Uncharacterized protein n=1 Tax=Bombardia bombarda TaxID=252184 RepID=A0AA39XJ92_9PEZI|nr:hypothetical protein B0T17DRAFT_502265 [Bombardia bombarda]
MNAMQSSADLSRTLDFLTDAGHLLATTAPETSAFLMRQRNNLMFENELPPPSDVHKQHVCNCCGHIMILGQGSSLKIEHKKAIQRKARSAGAHGAQRSKETRDVLLRSGSGSGSGPTKRLGCGHCGRLTGIKLPAPAPISRRKVRTQKADQTTTAPGLPAATQASISNDAPSQKANANASSKKRAKSRKAGLQALLQANATRGSGSGLGLSLADFREK